MRESLFTYRNSSLFYASWNNVLVGFVKKNSNFEEVKDFSALTYVSDKNLKLCSIYFLSDHIFVFKCYSFFLCSIINNASNDMILGSHLLYFSRDLQSLYIIHFFLKFKQRLYWCLTPSFSIYFTINPSRIPYLPRGFLLMFLM